MIVDPAGVNEGFALERNVVPIGRPLFCR